ncbi:LysE family translocator [Ferruginivarius sediminum]|uniref:LysE family translocator n=1 Tax=Ferruginivarius sediminum TaxID=2661937 RepID=A0A369TBE1_9PROT|nr:LysE family translocator [Ferruginivarius sediminum]RDD61497.1 LysE family translocator [Ferruginivarius sediminum]
MQVEHFIAFNITLLAAIASPGPALLIAMQTTLSAGRGPGIAIGCGLGLMAAIWTMMALLGLNAVFETVPWFYGVAKFIGAGYLLYIAWRMWMGANEPIKAHFKLERHAFRQGFLVNFLNPKAILFAAGVLVVIIPPDITMAENSFVVLNHLLIELIFYTSLAFVMNSYAVSRRYMKAKAYIDRTASLVLCALAFRLLLSN